MKRYKVGGLIWVFVVLSLNAGNFDEVISRVRKSVIPIKFVLKRETGGQEVENEHVQRAIVINEKLVVITDGGAISGRTRTSMGMFVIGGTIPLAREEDRSILKPRTAYVYVGKDTEVVAEFLGLNKNYDLAYFQLKPKNDQKLDLQPLPVIDEDKIDLRSGDEVYTLTLDMRGRKFGFPLHIGKEIVSYKFEGSKYEFAVGNVGKDFQIILDKNLNVLGFGWESPLTMRRGLDEGKGARVDMLDVSRYQLLFTKSKLDEIIQKIPKEGKVGWLGFLADSLEKVSEELREEFKLSKDEGGLRVKSILPKTPIDMAGLKIDDVIVEIAGKKAVFEEAKDMNEFMKWLGNELEIGKEYEVKFLRNEGGKYVERKINVTAIEKPLSFAEVDAVGFYGVGIKVKPITYDYRYNNRLSDEINGVVVTFVKLGEPFNIGGVRSGDIILALGDSKEGLRDVKSIDDLKEVLKKLGESKPVEVLVKIYMTDSKEVKIVTLRLGEKNYKELEKDLEK